MNDVSFLIPTNLDEAIAFLDQYGGKAKLLAGGTDLAPKLNYFECEFPAIVYIGKLGLDYINGDGEDIVIGAATPIAKILSSELLAKEAPILVSAAYEHSSPAIRTTGTIGGNIMNASPAADLVAPLYVLDAQLLVVGPKGERTIKIDEFFTGPGKTVCDSSEILKQIRIPRNFGSAAFVKLGKRKAQVLSVISASAMLQIENGICKQARISLGSVAPTVIRCKQAEQMLEGKAIDADLLRQCAEAAIAQCTPIDDSRASAWYRKEAGKGITRQALFAAAGLKYTD